MLEELLALLTPFLTDALYIVILGSLGSLGWLGIAAKSVLETKAAQDSLHRALDTGLDWVSGNILALARNEPTNMSVKDIAADMVTYVTGSVPDSIKKTKGSKEQIQRMAEARINDRLSSLKLYEDEQKIFH